MLYIYSQDRLAYIKKRLIYVAYCSGLSLYSLDPNKESYNSQGSSREARRTDEVKQTAKDARV